MRDIRRRLDCRCEIDAHHHMDAKNECIVYVSIIICATLFCRYSWFLRCFLTCKLYRESCTVRKQNVNELASQYPSTIFICLAIKLPGGDGIRRGSGLCCLALLSRLLLVLGLLFMLLTTTSGDEILLFVFLPAQGDVMLSTFFILFLF